MKTGFLISILLVSAMVFSQTDYKVSTKNKDGFTVVYNTVYTQGPGLYATSSSVTRYGIIDEKTKKNILPLSYKTAYTASEDGLYIITDTLDKVGLYNAKNGKFLVQPMYNRIEAFSEGLAVVQKRVTTGSYYSYDYFYGAIDKNGKLVIPDNYSYLSNCRDGLLSFKKEDKYGFIDKNNSVVIPAMYANAENFANGLAPVRLSDSSKYGYINTQNQFVIAPKYVDAEAFYKGYANVFVSKKGYSISKGNYGQDKVGLINTKGNEVIPPVYKYISLMNSQGSFKVTDNDEKQGLIDSTGKIILPIENKSIAEFNNEIAKVEKTSGMFGLVNAKGVWLLPANYNEVFALLSDAGFYVKKDGKYSVYDKNMKVIIAPDTAKRIAISKKNIAFIFDNEVKLFDITGKFIKTYKQENVDSYGTNFFSDGDSLKIAFFKSIAIYNLQTKAMQKITADDISDFNEEGIFAAKKSRWTFYDYTGKKLSTSTYENVVNFSDGICGLQASSTSKPYLADKSFNKIADLTTVFYGPYSEGLAMSKSQYGGSLSYLDKQGKEQFYAYATEGSACKDGRVKLKNSSNKYYFVNKSGKTINNSTYDYLGDFEDGLANFMDNKKGGYIDTAGNIAITAQYDEVSSFSNGIAMVKIGTEYFQIDKKGRPVTNDKYIAALPPLDGSFPAKKTTGYGLIDNKGKVIIDFKYDQVTAMYENMLWVQKDKKWAIANSTGKEVTGFIYDGGSGCDNGYVKVYKDNKIGVLDKSGKLILPIEYAQMSRVHNNVVIAVKPSGKNEYAIK